MLNYAELCNFMQVMLKTYAKVGFGPIQFAITRRRLLPVQIAVVGRRGFKFTIPDASRCPSKGRLHL
jgi:hypothetical protein